MQVVFDPNKVTYAKLLEYYWRTIDPTTKDRQFCDSGNPVPHRDLHARRTAAGIGGSVEESAERQQAVSRADRDRDRQRNAFYPAEDYHQDYYKKNPVRYKFYRANCGRDARLKQLWGAQAQQ